MRIIRSGPGERQTRRSGWGDYRLILKGTAAVACLAIASTVMSASPASAAATWNTNPTKAFSTSDNYFANPADDSGPNIQYYVVVNAYDGTNNGVKSCQIRSNLKARFVVNVSGGGYSSTTATADRNTLDNILKKMVPGHFTRFVSTESQDEFGDPQEIVTANTYTFAMDCNTLLKYQITNQPSAAYTFFHGTLIGQTLIGAFSNLAFNAIFMTQAVLSISWARKNRPGWADSENFRAGIQAFAGVTGNFVAIAISSLGNWAGAAAGAVVSGCLTYYFEPAYINNWNYYAFASTEAADALSVGEGVNANPSSPASVTTVVDGLETGEQWFDAAYNWAGEASSLGAQIRSLVAGSWNVQEGTFAGRQVIEHLTDIELQQIEGQGGSGC